MAAVSNPKQNHLLDALLAAEYDRKSPNSAHIKQPLGHVLYEPSGLLAHVYFPTTASLCCM